MTKAFKTLCSSSLVVGSLLLANTGYTADEEQATNTVPKLPETHLNYANITLPSHYTSGQTGGRGRNQIAAIEFDNTPANNPITDAGATLGRVLFYDVKLSANGTVSCASCHQAAAGFADNKAQSVGFAGELTRRNSMGLTNARFYDSGKFFWDERADTLEEQVLMPFQDDVEMGITLARLEEIVRAQSYYPALFEQAFGNSVVSSERISLALAQFIRSMVSTGSKYDLARRTARSPGQRFRSFTALENQGKSLFFRPNISDGGQRVTCASCHTSEAFVGTPGNPNGNGDNTIARSNGLDPVSTDDFGVYETTRRVRDMGKFKTPSLRNVEVTAPYMHDGRFATLEQVIEHYSTGIQAHRNLPRQLRNGDGSPVRLNFSATEKAALVAFLETLTDNAMLQDERWSDPFL